MTETLKTLLHERAAEVDFATPDLDALTRAGDRRVRRHRGALAGAVALAALAVAVPVGLSVGGDADRVADSGPAQQTVPFPRGPVTWARGATIHYGERTLDVGRPVEAFVSTEYGFLVASEGDVLAVDGSEVAKVGQVDRRAPLLVSDEDGSLAGWVQRGTAEPTFAVQDLAANVTSVAFVGRGEFEAPVLYAIDGTTAYLRDDRGAQTVDLDSGRSEVLDPAPGGNGFGITDVEGGVIAYLRPDLDDDVAGDTVVGSTLDGGIRLEGAFGSTGALSPSGHYYSGDDDTPAVYDVTTGERLTFDLPGFATGYEWLDDDTVVLIAAADPEGPVDLVACTVPDGSCEVAVPDLGTFDELEDGFALPVGQPLG